MAVDWDRIVTELRDELARCERDDDAAGLLCLVSLVSSLEHEAHLSIWRMDPKRQPPAPGIVEHRQRRTDHLVDLTRRTS